MSEQDFLSALREAIRSDSTRKMPEAAQLDFAGISNLLNEDIASRVGDEKMRKVSPHDYDCDVLVITPIIKELRMAAIAFDCDYDNPAERDKGLPVFKLDLERQNNLPPITVKLATMSNQRNVNSGPLTAYLINKHRPRTAMLSGIAAIKKGRQMGQASAFTTVTYTSGGVETPDGKDPEPQINNISETMRNILLSYEDRRELKSANDEFGQRFHGLVQKIDGEVPPAKVLAAFEPAFNVKKLLSGETLRKDGGFTAQAEAIDRLITMVEMEASGFAVACEQAEIEWCVFRASCDYGDPDKNDEWQRVAALNSALALRHCLETEYRNLSEMSF